MSGSLQLDRAAQEDNKLSFCVLFHLILRPLCKHRNDQLIGFLWTLAPSATYLSRPVCFFQDVGARIWALVEMLISFRHLQMPGDAAEQTV